MIAPSIIPCQRHLFDVPDDIAYLNCAYFSPFLRSVTEAGIAGVHRRDHPWEIVTRHFFEEAEEARRLFATLIGANADDIAIIPATSYGIAIAVENIPLRRDQRVVVLEDQFPSNYYGWLEQCRRVGATLVSAPRPADDDWTGSVLRMIDERTAVVAVPHVHWTDGGLLDLVAIGARCRAVGAALVIDVAQSIGALPIDVGTIQPDFLVAACYKWMLGPYNLGFCYIAPHRQEGRPLEENWIAREGSDQLSNLLDYQDGYLPGARRFDLGQRGNFHLLPMAIAALKQLHAWGVPNIQATIRLRTDRIAERAAAFQIRAVPRERRAGHYLGLRFSGGVPDGLAERLAREKVYVSVRGRDAVRVTPHLWVNDRDEDRFIAVLEQAVKGR
jgi:selenocysteine lyase/cysteine desulfurase